MRFDANTTPTPTTTPRRARTAAIVAATMIVALLATAPRGFAQPGGGASGSASDAQAKQLDRRADEAVANAQRDANAADKTAQAAGAPADGHPLDWFTLILFEGGIFMYPIGAMSLVMVMFGIERAIGLRRGKVLPGGLIDAFGQIAATQGGFDPRQAYRVCQDFPSAAATVIRAMLLKVGRPHSEVEHAVAEAEEREAAKLYSNVRWLNLAAAVAPLLGLLGTVQGMIMAFHKTAYELLPGQNKAQALAEGIYTALVTTFAGLCVAIPATLLSHWFEGRIQSLFRDIDELLFNLLPQVERYEGKLRVNRVQLGDGSGEPSVAAPPVAAIPIPESPMASSAAHRKS